MQRKDCRHTDGRYHDCIYVDARARLIPIAEARAQAVELRGFDFNTAFHAEMDELWRSRGVNTMRAVERAHAKADAILARGVAAAPFAQKVLQAAQQQPSVPPPLAAASKLAAAETDLKLN